MAAPVSPAVVWLFLRAHLACGRSPGPGWWGALAACLAAAGWVFFGAAGGTAFPRLLVGIPALAGIGALLLRAVFRSPDGWVALGIALALAATSVTQALAEGTWRAVVDVLTRHAGHLVVSEYGLDFDEYDEVADRIERIDGVAAVVPFVHVPLSAVRLGERDEPSGPVVVTAGTGRPPPTGRTMGGATVVVTPADPGRPPGVSLGRGLAARLGAEVGDRLFVAVPSAVGAERGSGAARGTVVEVAALVASGVAVMDDRALWMHLTTAQALAFRRRRVSGLAVHVRDPDAVDAVARGIQARLGSRFRVATFQETMAGFASEVRRFRAVAAVVSTVILLASAGSVYALVLLAGHRMAHGLAVMEILGLARAGPVTLLAAHALAVAAAGIGVGAGLAVGTTDLLSRIRVPLKGAGLAVERVHAALGPWDLAVPAAGVGVLAIGAAVAGATVVRRRKIR